MEPINDISNKSISKQHLLIIVTYGNLMKEYILEERPFNDFLNYINSIVRMDEKVELILNADYLTLEYDYQLNKKWSI